MIRFLLLLIARHKCSLFHIEFLLDESNILELIRLLSPYISTLRNNCTSCHSSIPDISISDIAHLMVRNKTNEWTVAIDMNVYSKNQQFRLFNSVKYGKTNPLIPSIKFPFKSEDKLTDTKYLQRSIITFIDNDKIPTIHFNDNRFLLEYNISRDFGPMDMGIINYPNINLINDSIANVHCAATLIKRDENSNPKKTCDIQKLNHTSLSDSNIQKYLDFVENIITIDSSHRGYIHSCVRGSLNKNLFFFNISGEYRYCPKKKDHHRRNSVALIVDSKKNVYSIRCKDKECNNSILNWMKIK